jgi:hypothetical protein
MPVHDADQVLREPRSFALMHLRDDASDASMLPSHEVGATPELLSGNFVSWLS